MSELDFEDSADIGKKSKYNSAFAQLIRLNSLWELAHKYGSTINYSKLNEVLDRVWLELSPNAKTEDEKTLIKINRDLLKLCIYGVSEKLRLKNPILYNQIILLQKETIMKKERLLRRMEDKQGKGAAYEDDIEDYMD